MSNRILNSTLAMEKQMVCLYGSAVIGSAGAVGTVKGLGIASVVHGSTGVYTITLEDSYDYYKFGSWGFANNSTGSGVAAVEVKMDLATLQATVKSAKTIVLQCYDFAGAAVDPAAASVLTFTVELRRSSVGPV
jgi:hypothetical protein